MPIHLPNMHVQLPQLTLDIILFYIKYYIYYHTHYWIHMVMHMQTHPKSFHAIMDTSHATSIGLMG